MPKYNYLVKFKPLEPYFFGKETYTIVNERKDLERNRTKYFIRSDELPTQTTLLGTIRYCLLEKVNSNHTISEKDKKVIGDKSFKIDNNEVQDFGYIKKVSPMFLIKQEETREKIIPLPLDHDTSQQNEDKIYMPFKEYKRIQTTQGEKYIPQYDAKSGLASGFIDLLTEKIIDEELFQHIERSGNAKGKDEEGFFKMEYVQLKKEYAFATYVHIELPDTSKPLENKIAYLGKKKSTFLITFEKVDGMEIEYSDKYEDESKYLEALQRLHKDSTLQKDGLNIYMAVSDCYVSQKIYEKCKWAATTIRDYKVMINSKNAYGGYYKKEAVTMHLIRAGSVFVVSNDEKVEFLKYMNDGKEQLNCKKIGLNQIYKLGGVSDDSRCI